jgi:phage repressor protein C with HTH and peptisase S24 domain
MADVDPRGALERLISDRGEDMAGLSRLIGRNAAYLQQFIRRGTPRRLAESDRRVLASYFGVDEAVLGAAPASAAPALKPVPRLPVEASAGPGSVPGADGSGHQVGFDANWLRRIAGGSEQLSIIEVRGDSMVPTLVHGDEILVDGSETACRLRDGIYVLRMDGALLVKRLSPEPSGRRVAVRSDNPAYPSWEDCTPDMIDVVGRVVWAGRRIS